MRMSLVSPGASVTIPMSVYQIGYQVTLAYIPSVTEVDAVVGVTQVYLDEVFKTVYSNLLSVETLKVSDRLMLNAPYEIVYNSTAVFQLGSTIPSLEELNAALQQTFTGDGATAYISLLAGLGQDNAFCKCLLAAWRKDGLFISSDLAFTLHSCYFRSNFRLSCPNARGNQSQDD